MSDLINKAYKKFIGEHGMNLFSRDDETIAKRSFEAGYNAAPALSATPVVGGGGGQPWGNEPWEEYLERQREKARYLEGQRDAALLAAKTWQNLLDVVRELVLSPIPSFEEAEVPASPAPLVAAGAGQGDAEACRLLLLKAMDDTLPKALNEDEPLMDTIGRRQAHRQQFEEISQACGLGPLIKRSAPPQPEATPRPTYDYSAYVNPDLVRYLDDKVKRDAAH